MAFVLFRFKEESTINTEKNFSEAIANKCAPKDTSKVLDLKKLD